jgi:hypothetical protein
MKPLNEMTVHELLITYGSIQSAMRDYEVADRTFGVRYTNYERDSKALEEEAKRRDKLVTRKG